MISEKRQGIGGLVEGDGGIREQGRVEEVEKVRSRQLLLLHLLDIIVPIGMLKRYQMAAVVEGRVVHVESELLLKLNVHGGILLVILVGKRLIFHGDESTFSFCHGVWIKATTSLLIHFSVDY